MSSLRSVDESVAEDIPEKEPRVDDEEADVQRALEESLKSIYDVPRGPLPSVVIREPQSGKYQPLPEVPGKGKEKVTEEQVSRDLLTLQTPKKKSPADRYIFQRRTSMPTGSSGHDESSSLYAELGLTDSEDEFDEDVPGTDAGVQGEGQAGPNPDAQDEGQAGLNPNEQAEGQARPNPGDAEASQPLPSPVVHDGSDLEHMDLDVADVSTQPHPEQMDEGFSATAYPKVQKNLKLTVEEHVILEEPASSSGTLSSLQHLTKDLSFGDLFFSDKPSEVDNDKATTETEAESMVPESPKVHQLLKSTATETTTTTTTIHPPPSQPQQSTTDSMLMKCIGELEHIMANLIQDNKQLEQRLDSHGARLYTLEHLDIPHQVSKVVDEVVTNAVDWAMQALLRNHFRDLPEADMKEILHQRMWETESYKTYEDHMQLYEALEKSMNRDHSEELLKDLAEARKKKKKRRDSPKMPPGSPPHHPPPPPPPAGPSGASRSPGASRSSQVPPSPPLPPSTNQKDLQMDDDMAPDVQAQSSDDEEWWKPLEEERPATSEPAWSIPSSDVPVPKSNWESALASTYSPPPEDSLLSQTGDIAMFIDWFCKRRGITELKPQDLKGPAFELVKVFHPNEYLRYGSKGSRPALSISKTKAAYYPDVGLEQMVPDQIWIEEECKYDIAAMYGISHWWFQRQRFYIDRHTYEGDRRAVRTHMQILSVVRIEVFSMYGHLVIQQQVEDFQLGIESYQTQLNLTKPRWDATGFEYKHDYTLIDSPRAVTFRDRYGVQMIMRFNEIHKKDVDRSKEFMFAIQKRLKTKRIFRKLESFVSGRVRKEDYKLLKPNELTDAFGKPFEKLAPKRTTKSSPATTTATTTSVTDAQLKVLIDQGVARALAAHDADRSRNDKDSHDSGMGVRRQTPPARECTYPDFMKCQPLNFKDTEGVVELTQWFEKMETMFRISNCSMENQIKFSTCTLLGNLKKKMTDKYCPRVEIKKLEFELWNLKVKGTNVIGYNQRFQELALLCFRMFPEESDKIERYIGGFPDMIHGSVVASKAKTMQEAIKMETELLYKKIRTFAERQTENKRRQHDNNNQAQQQPLKKQGVEIAYTAGLGERKEYAGTLPLCNKCKFHHNGQCTVKYVNCKRVGQLTRDCRSPAATNNHGKPTCYECGNQGHYRSDYPELKNQDRGNQAGGTGAHGMVHALEGGETNQDLNDVEDDINA
nr:hypothetical protein [Tanacetum cinerariifolium]